MKPASSSTLLPLHPAVDPTDVHDAILKRAEEIYIRNGRIPGHDLENWTQAEQEILREKESALKGPAVVIVVNGVQYMGRYKGDSCEGYQPGEFPAGADVAVRFEGEKMFLKRPNGKELETTIVTRID